MLALCFEAPRRVAVRHETLAPPGPGEVRVANLVSAISAGTELLVYRGQVPGGMALDATLPGYTAGFCYPTRYGYAAVGRVVELGDGVDRTWHHRLVLSLRPHQSELVVEPAELLPVPEELTAEEAALLPNLETAVTLLMDGRPLVGERVMVFGQGVVGLLTTALLARFPLAELTTWDPVAQRRRRGLELGAGAALDPADAAALAAAAGSADLVYELSGSPAALAQAIAVTGFAGRVIVGSWYGDQPVALPLGGAFHRSRIRLTSSQVSTVSPALAARWSRQRRRAEAWRLLAALRPAELVPRLVSHRFPLAAAAAAYELLDQRPDEALQVLLVYEA